MPSGVFLRGFLKAHLNLLCFSCGSGEGAEIGPDLTGIGTQFDRVALAEAILFPSQTVREG